MGEWFCEDSIWKRSVAPSVWAYVREHDGRYEVTTGTHGTRNQWQDYCAAQGGVSSQEYKAKRRATALARKLIKGG